MKKVTLKSVVDQFPKEAWLREQQDQFVDEEVFVIEDQDTVMEDLSLEYEGDVVAYFVKGNLTAKNITNSNTDGALSLIVMGNLTAENIIAGGQQIWVEGNLKVKEVFWGDYNHGGLEVKGDVEALVFAETDQYHVEIKGSRKIEKYIWDEGEEALLGQGVNGYFVPGTYMLDDRMEMSFARDEILELLKAGKSLLKPAAERRVTPKTPAFSWDQFTHEAFDRLTSSPLIHNDVGFFYHIEDVEVLLKRPEPVPNESYMNGAVAFVQDGTWALYMYYNVQNKNGSLVKEPIQLLYSNLKTNPDDPKWELAASKDDLWPVYRDMLFNFWPLVEPSTKRIEDIKESEITEMFKKIGEHITVDKIEKYLDLPIIKDKYNDYDDGDKMGYWSGAYSFAFRRPSDEDRGRIQIVAERPSKTLSKFPSVEDEFDTHGYQFDIFIDEDGKRGVQIRYIAHNAWGSRPLNVFELDHYEKALLCWQYFEANIMEDNQNFLSSEDDEDDE